MTQNRKAIVITGGIASGKSSVASMLRNLGYCVIDADTVGHDILHEYTVKREIFCVFGSNVFSGEDIDRRLLSKTVFSDKIAKMQLEKIVHYRIVNKIISYLNSATENIFVEIPLYFEVKDLFDDAGFEFDSVWSVETDGSEQIRRIMNRNGCEESDAILRIKSQASVLDRASIADIIIYNNSDISELEAKVKRALACEFEDRWI